MLPTTGFFKDIDCPYYENSCERPYCHFKHRKKIPEPVETTKTAPAAVAPEVPTYNPTPKSQLANSRSHIPISYVPDLAVRSERNNLRSMSSYGYGDKPTYNPTPLSILSTGKVSTSLKTSENLAPTLSYSYSEKSDDETIVKTDTPKYSPTYTPETPTNNIHFEEIDMDDQITNEPSPVNGESESTEEDKQKSRSSDKPKVDKKHNGKLNESSSRSKSDSKSKSRSHSSKSSKSDSKHKSKSGRDDVKKTSSSRGGSKSEEKSKEKEKEKKHESKDKRSSSHKDKDRHKRRKSKERDKEKKSSEKDKKKHREKQKDKDDSRKREEIKIKKEESSDDYNNISEYEDSELEENTLEECYKIFTEYKPTEPDIFAGLTMSEQGEEIQQNEDNSSSLFGKKRIAHENANQTQSKVLFSKPKNTPTAAQAMVNRLKAVRLAHANNEQNNIINEVNRYVLKRPLETPTVNENKKVQKISVTAKPSTSTSTSLVDDILSGKSTNAKPKRIAPVQNVNSIQRAKAKIEEMAKMRAVNAIVKTSSQTISRGSKRVAHIPETPVLDIPDVLESERSKLPVNVRTRFLKMIVDECVKLYLSTDDAQQRAINEEFKCYERCSALATYRNSSMLAISRLRKELQEREMGGLGPILPGEATNSSKDNKSELRGRKLYENIKKYVLNEEELVLHGFPREGSVPGRAVVKNQRKVSKSGYLSEDDRMCCRCGKLYKIDKDGFALYEEECLYHPLKKRTFRGESIYLCCKSSEDLGCVTANTHVSEGLPSTESEIEGYQTTLPAEWDEDPRSFEVFALDCEMCYTTKGLELTRVTIVNSECKTVYESLVKPLNSIIDYNTRFSGITEEQMNRTATSILQVQANILHLCNSNTILIGHSLESDMKALKIIHNTIIDTSVLFPHKFGLPHKRALRDLAREFLKKIIQNDVSGHDSAEDALTCMELVQWKLKEELKVRGVKA